MPRSKKVREMISLVTADGWYQHRTKGSHRIFRHPTKKGTVTIAGKPGDNLPPDTVASILKQAQIIDPTR